MNSEYFWGSVILLGLGTQFIRLSFVFLHDRLKIPEAVKNSFAYIPAAVLPALIAPAVVYHPGHVTELLYQERLVALVIAALICYKTKRLFLTIASGLVILFLLHQI